MASVILSGTPAEVAAGALPPAVPQTLSLAGNTISLSAGGGSVDVAASTTVAATQQKTTAISYTPGFLQTDVAGRFAVGTGSIIGNTTVEGGKVTVSRGAVNPKIELNREDVLGGVGTIEYDGSAWAFNPALPTPAPAGLAAVLAVSSDASGQPIDNTGTITMAGAQPLIQYDPALVSQTITNLVPGFANFWFATVADTTGFVGGQTCQVSGIDATDLGGNPIVPSPFTQPGQTVNIGNVAGPTQLWLTFSTPYVAPGSILPVLNSATVSQSAAKTLIGFASGSGTVLNGVMRNQTGQTDIKANVANLPILTVSDTGTSSAAFFGQNSYGENQIRVSDRLQIAQNAISNSAVIKHGFANGQMSLEQYDANYNNIAARMRMSETDKAIYFQTFGSPNPADQTALILSDQTQDMKITNNRHANTIRLDANSATTGVVVKSANGSVRFNDSTDTEKATVKYAELTNKITVAAPGAGQVALDAGTGGLTLATDADLVLDGAALLSGTAGANLPLHLRIKLNGTYYKIQLKAD